ncbi:MAG: LppX_LprAFG lipoprotein [Dehalococcoidia bacterium]|nr:LppX_LprAFG lipoprotein [Dehalococcoidia bacterium]
MVDNLKRLRKAVLMTKRLLLLLPWLAGAFLLLGACGGDDDDDGSNEDSDEATVTETPQDFLSSAADEIEQLENFHFLLTHENGATDIVLDLAMTRAEGDVIPPDTLQADVEAEGPGGIGIDTEVIAIDDEVFFGNPFGGGFITADFDIGEILDPVGGVVALLRNAPDDVEYAASETIGGVDTQVVAAAFDSALLEDLIPGADPGFQVEVTIWIGKDDRLPYRVLLVGPLNEDDPADIERLIELSSFNGGSLTIEPPE